MVYSWESERIIMVSVPSDKLKSPRLSFGGFHAEFMLGERN